MTAIATMVALLRDPTHAGKVEEAAWPSVVSVARAEALLATLAHRLKRQALPDRVGAVLRDAIDAADIGKRQALWEADCARRALGETGIAPVLMKGTAYLAADMQAGVGRTVGDLDIMVAAADLDRTEKALLAAGWEWVKQDAYDDRYYRTHMHELPPMIHRDRDRMIDVHHTTLPLTARPQPDAATMLNDAVSLPNGHRVMAPTDMLLHSVAHLFADGDLAGGLRNLWDIHCMAEEFATEDGFADRLQQRARRHGLELHLNRALRLSRHVYRSGSPRTNGTKLSVSDRLYVRRLMARDRWGTEARPATRFAFYVRSHWLRMPPAMLAGHLFTKWRKSGT